MQISYPAGNGSQEFGTTYFVHETGGYPGLVTNVERMSQRTFEFEPAIRRFERQAAELMHKDTDILTVVTEFAFTDAPISGPAESEWEAQYGYRPMVRAFYCKELAGFITTELSEYLTDAGRARTLGFNPAQFAADKTAPDRASTTHGVIASLISSHPSLHSPQNVCSRLPTT